jgi:hypothetical protein
VVESLEVLPNRRPQVITDFELIGGDSEIGNSKAAAVTVVKAEVNS